MDILAALANKKKESQAKADNDENNKGYMHPSLFRTALERAGCDLETIEDCLFEFPEKWEYLLNYFEDKNNGSKY